MQRRLLVLAALITANQALAQYSFTGFSLPYELGKGAFYGVSYDGGRIVGATPDMDGFARPFYLNGLAPQYLPLGAFGNGFARGVNPDGSIIVGQVTPGHALSPDHAAVWTNGVLSLLQDEPNFVQSHANAISGDGRVVVGISDSSTHATQAARWVDGQVFPMGDLNGGSFLSASLGVNADGSVIVGYANSHLGNTTAFRWADGVMAALPNPAGDYIVSSSAFDVSADGTVIVGGVHHDPPDMIGSYNAVVWRNGVPEDIRNTLPGGVFENALRVSDDGETIFGEGAVGTTAAIVIWDTEHGGQSLAQILLDAGVDLQGWRLTQLQDVSGDGKTIVGYGYDDRGQFAPFIATIPEPGITMMLVGLAAAGSLRRR